jgi:hypothetical protein
MQILREAAMCCKRLETAEALGIHAFGNLPQTPISELHRLARPGAWRENLSSAEQAAIQRIIGPTLLELGYGVDAQ